MEAFNISYNVLSAVGVWRPTNLSSKSDIIIFSFFRLLVVPCPYLLNIGLLCRLILHNISFDEFSETFFLYIVTCGICFKSYNFLRRQNELISLSDMLWSKYSSPQNEAEMWIRSECNRFIRY